MVFQGVRQVKGWKSLGYSLVILYIALFGVMHAVHLSADFPHSTAWPDWAKYTDEGYWGKAAVHSHLFGDWYVPGDFNPAPAVPVLPSLEWILFYVTGVSIQAARGLAVFLFFVNLLLVYRLLCVRWPPWTGLLAIAILVSSPFLYCFSRLAILEPLLLTLTLSAMNLILHLNKYRRQGLAAAALGFLFTLMFLTKTNAIFFLPALVWMIVVPLRHERRQLYRILLWAGCTSAASLAVWMSLIVVKGYYNDFKYLFTINVYEKPHGFVERTVSLIIPWYRCLSADFLLVPLTFALVLGVFINRRNKWSEDLPFDPLFGGSLLMALGCIGFMTYQNNASPRYCVVADFFLTLVLAQIVAKLVHQNGGARKIGALVSAFIALAVVQNSFQVTQYLLRPQYTFVDATRHLTQYIDQHPNGNRVLSFASADDITLMTGLNAISDVFGTQDLPDKLMRYRPGWYATWNLDPRILAKIHIHYSLEQVAVFPAFGDREMKEIRLFKLHALPNGQSRSPNKMNLAIPLPDDQMNLPGQ